MALVFAFGLACHQEPETPEPTEYFHLGVGHWWAYQTQRGSNLDTASWTLGEPETTFVETSKIVAEEGGVYTWVLRRDTVEDTSYLFLRGDTLMLAMVKRVVMPTDTTDTITVSDTVPFAPCPLVPGSRWASEPKLVLTGDIDGDSVEDTVYYHLEAEVAREEEVQTPAGNFTALYVRYSHTFDIHSSQLGYMNVPLPQRLWWAPNVGVVRWVDKDYRESQNPWEAPDLIRLLEAWE